MTVMLELIDVTVRFGGVVAVDDVSLAVAGQQIHGLIGPNGSGKTTLLNAATGVVAAAGTLRVDGSFVRLGSPLRSRSAGVLRVFQAPQVFAHLTCLENTLLARGDTAAGVGAAWLARPLMWQHERNRWAAGRAGLERVGLGDLADTPAELLTYGQQRLLELARAITADPKVILLDEPSAGLNDSETEELTTLCRSLRSDGLTLLVVDHKIDFLDSICDRLSVLELGHVISEGTPAYVWADSRVIEAYLGGPADA